MATMNISLPDQMKAWVEQQVATGRYANASDYVRDLVRRAQVDDEMRRELREAAAEGLASGFSDGTAEDARANVRRRLGAGQTRRAV